QPAHFRFDLFWRLVPPAVDTQHILAGQPIDRKHGIIDIFNWRDFAVNQTKNGEDVFGSVTEAFELCLMRERFKWNHCYLIGPTGRYFTVYHQGAENHCARLFRKRSRAPVTLACGTCFCTSANTSSYKR